MARETNRQWLVASSPEGKVGESNFNWTESPIPTPGPGQALVRNLWLDIYPTQVLLMSTPPEAGGVSIGSVMRGIAVSEVIESFHPTFRPGDLVHGISGWEDYSLTDGHGFFETTKVPPGVPPNLALGALGVTGMVAYFGIVEIGRPKKGETCVVSAAAGGVGSVAAQIAKIHELRVIGIAGGPAKCDWLTKEAGLDAAIDHRTEDVPARLDALCPDGIDIYFDNVGGPILNEALARLRNRGRVVLSGITSWYMEKDRLPGPSQYTNLIMRNGRMEGLLGRDYAPRFSEAIPIMQEWIRSGQLKSKEDVAQGLENAPRALARLFSGENIGKQLLRVADPRLPRTG
ncbi:MAG: NADP-dependent oxidoreductase [Thermoplasmata archaeon]|nr:NADP-dependent oxidoreductase [Thermoplasmata archaeon]